MSAGSLARKWHRLLVESAGAKAICVEKRVEADRRRELLKSTQIDSCQAFQYLLFGFTTFCLYYIFR